jgi:hypothetical protein
MGYLMCNQCGGYYRLHDGESPDDFDNNCECGGKLKYFDSLGGVTSLNRTNETIGNKIKNPKEHYFIPFMMILVSIECILSIFYDSNFIIILGVIGLLFGLFLLFIRFKSLEHRIYPRTRRIIYFFSTMIFLFQGFALVILWFEIDFDILAKIGVLIFIFLAMICGLNMILKTIDPDNRWNKLDPPL